MDSVTVLPSSGKYASDKIHDNDERSPSIASEVGTGGT